MRRSWLTVIVVMGLIAAVSGCTGASGPSGESIARAVLQRDVDVFPRLGVTGAQARAYAPETGERWATSGVAALGTSRKVSPEGHFRMGSTTKTFTATVILQLVGEGRLRLEDPVRRWLPGLLAGNGYDERKITVRHLLQHTSGLADDSYPMPQTAAEYYRTRFTPLTPHRIVTAALRHKPLFAPGAGWSYANTGYVVAGMIIEKITGRRWYEEVTARIFRPLALAHTRWPGRSAQLPAPHATGYTRFAAGQPLVDTTQLISVDSSGGLVTTTADLNRFFRALLGGKLLRPAQLAAMTRTVPVDRAMLRQMPGASYGLGLMRLPLACGGHFWNHGGSDLGWGTFNGVTEKGERAVTLSISTEDVTAPANAEKQMRAFLALTRHALCGRTS